MGITLGNCHHSIDMGYGGFSRLRTKVAYLHSKELGDFYKKIDDGLLLYGKDRDDFFKEYNKRLRNIDEELNVSHYILDFLYKSDTGARLSPKHCRRIWNLIKDCDDDIKYGYSAYSDCATFKDFKEIIKECRDKNIMLYWR